MICCHYFGNASLSRKPVQRSISKVHFAFFWFRVFFHQLCHRSEIFGPERINYYTAYFNPMEHFTSVRKFENVNKFIVVLMIVVINSKERDDWSSVNDYASHEASSLRWN